MASLWPETRGGSGLESEQPVGCNLHAGSSGCEDFLIGCPQWSASSARSVSGCTSWTKRVATVVVALLNVRSDNLRSVIEQMDEGHLE